MHNGQRDLTEGKIVRPMIAFALPLIAGNMLQTLYNAADSVIVGRFVGSGALAAVGSAYSLMTFLTSLMIGLSMGVSVAFSRLFGRKEYSSLKEAVAVSFVLIALISAAITALAWILLPQIIRLLSVPEELSEMMGSYMYIILTGLPALFIYNFYASAERSIGNSAAALMMMALSAIMNIILDLYFVISLGWGIEGAAAATVISQYAAAIAIALYALLRSPILRFRPSDARRGWKMLPELLSLSVLTSLQQSIMNLGILMVQGIVNSFGSSVMAAFAAGVKIDSLAYMPLQEFGNAFSVFVAQNEGAGRKDRIRKGMKSAFFLTTAFGLAISIAVFIIPRLLLSIFIDPGEAAIIDIGVDYLRLEGSFYILIGYLFLFYGIFRAAGHPAVSLFLTIISLGLRVLLASLLSIPFGPDGIWISIPIGWVMADAAGLILVRVKRIISR